LSSVRKRSASCLCWKPNFEVTYLSTLGSAAQNSGEKPYIRFFHPRGSVSHAPLCHAEPPLSSSRRAVAANESHVTFPAPGFLRVGIKPSGADPLAPFVGAAAKTRGRFFFRGSGGGGDVQRPIAATVAA
jgi:hypothetical protein